MNEERIVNAKDFIDISKSRSKTEQLSSLLRNNVPMMKCFLWRLVKKFELRIELKDLFNFDEYYKLAAGDRLQRQ